MTWTQRQERTLYIQIQSKEQPRAEVRERERERALMTRENSLTFKGGLVRADG